MTLRTYQINRIKITIANKESRLQEDITDSEVFDYLEDMAAVEQLLSVATHGSADPEDWSHRPTRTRRQLADYAVEESYSR